MKVESLERQRLRSAWLFVFPMLAILAAVAAWPLLRTVYFGFTDATLDGLDEAAFVGLGNYVERFDYGDGTIEKGGILFDGLWWKAVGNTIAFSVVSVFLETCFGLIVALVLHKSFPGRGVVRAAVLVPWAIPTIVSAKMWAWMLNDQFGVINSMLMSLHLIDSPIAWTASPDTAMFAVVLVDVWKTTPFMALLILAAMQMLPKDIYEVSRLNGISPVKQFFRVTLPLIKPALAVAVIFRTMDALRVFDLIYVLTPGSEQTMTMSVFARQHLFDFDKFAYGAAASTLLFLIIAIITLIYIRVSHLDLGGKRE